MNPFATAAFALFLTAPSFADTPAIESEVFEASGTHEEIAKRGELCIAQLVKNDGLSVKDATNGAGLLGTVAQNPFDPKNDKQLIQAGNVIVASNADTVVANNRLPIQQFLTGRTIIQSVITLFAKDGRFKISHSDVQFAIQNTGYLDNNGFGPLDPKAKLYGKASSALQELSTQIAQCVKQKSDW